MVSYIGVSGVTSREQVQSILEMLPVKPKRKVMIGVAQTYKSLRKISLSPPWGKRTPDKNELPSICLGDKRLFNIVHYASAAPRAILSDLEEIVLLSGPNFHGVQLNVPLDLDAPGEELAQIAKFAQSYPWSYNILNLYPPTLASVAYSPWRLKKGITPYLPHINAVLIDLSGGRGSSFESEVGLRLVDAMYEISLSAEKNIAIGLAGGLGPSRLDLLEDFADYLPILSIDAEGNLRTDNDLDLEKLRLYLTEAFSLFE